MFYKDDILYVGQSWSWS